METVVECQERCLGNVRCGLGGELTLEFTRAVNDDQHAVTCVGVLGAGSQVAGNVPGEGFLGCWDAGCDGRGRVDAVGRRAVAENQAHCHAVCRVALGIPGHQGGLALSDGLEKSWSVCEFLTPGSMGGSYI